MPKSIKIFIAVVAALGLLSGVFLLTSKKASNVPKTPIVKSAAPVAASDNLAPKTEPPRAVAPKAAAPDRKALARAQWQRCQAKTWPAETELLWSVLISEGIPMGGTYAKGNLNSDPAMPERNVAS